MTCIFSVHCNISYANKNAKITGANVMKSTELPKLTAAKNTGFTAASKMNATSSADLQTQDSTNSRQH